MGLDQSLIRMSKESFDLIDKWQRESRQTDDNVPFPDVETESVWTGRKENHIQAFIEGEVGDVDNCGYLPVSKADVERLVDRLAKVDADHTQAGVLLPTQEGFFFGGTDYNEWYFEDVKQELEDFTKILYEWEDDAVYAYWAWW